MIIVVSPNLFLIHCCLRTSFFGKKWLETLFVSGLAETPVEALKEATTDVLAEPPSEA